MADTIFYRKGDTEIPGGSRKQGHFIVTFEAIFQGMTKAQAELFRESLKTAAKNETDTPVEVYEDGVLIGKAWDFGTPALTPNAVEFWGDFTKEVTNFYKVEFRIKV